jgi:hypothetical protein
MQLVSIILIVLPEIALSIIASKRSTKEAKFKLIDILSYMPLLASFFCIISILTNSSKYINDKNAPFFVVNAFWGLPPVF